MLARVSYKMIIFTSVKKSLLLLFRFIVSAPNVLRVPSETVIHVLVEGASNVNVRLSLRGLPAEVSSNLQDGKSKVLVQVAEKSGVRDWRAKNCSLLVSRSSTLHSFWILFVTAHQFIYIWDLALALRTAWWPEYQAKFRQCVSFSMRQLD